MIIKQIKKSDFSLKHALSLGAHIVIDSPSWSNDWELFKELGYSEQQLFTIIRQIEESEKECGTLYPQHNITILYPWFWGLNEFRDKYINDIIVANEMMQTDIIYIYSDHYRTILSGIETRYKNMENYTIYVVADDY